MLYYIHQQQHNCKCIFTGTNIQFDTIKKIDHQNDFYINIKKENDELTKRWADFSLEYNVSLDINLFSYKPSELLDTDSIRYERKRKLEKLNKISNEWKKNANYVEE